MPGLVRCRLNFDYPPPAVSCRVCWLLVDLNSCRVVADVESLIRERFGFSRTTTVSLFIQDGYLPHTESVHVLRDDDCIRVKVDSLIQVNGCSRDEPSKRKATPEDDEPGGDEVRMEKKRKKRKRTEQSISDQTLHNTSQKKKKKKEKKTRPPPPSEPAAFPKPLRISNVSRRSSEKEKDTAPLTSSTKPTAPKTPAPKPVQTRPSSSETDSSDDEATVRSKHSICKSSTAQTRHSTSETSPVKTAEINSGALTTKCHADPLQPPSSQNSSDCAEKPSESSKGKDSDSEEEIKLVIRRPLPITSWLGRGQRTPRKQRGRGGGCSRGRGFDSTVNGAKQPSCDSNAPLVIQEEGVNPVPQQDYSSMPLLAAPPHGGQKIAFKLLELSDNYTPEVSEYKEGKILSFDPTTNQIELELLTASQAPSGPGKFDLVYQNADGSERVEYAVSRGSRVTERWETLLEPRLII